MDVENIEFLALLKVSGWKPVEVARRLHLTRGAISQYMSGKSSPSPQVLELFKLAVAGQKPSALTVAAANESNILAEWERKIIEDLRSLHHQDRERILEAIRALIKGLPRRPPTQYPKLNSGERAKIRELVCAAAEDEPPESEKPAARTTSPSRGVSPETSSGHPPKSHSSKHS